MTSLAVQGEIESINISSQKGRAKDRVQQARLEENFGLLGDAHAGDYSRQVSLLAVESFKKISVKGVDVYPGIFAENITTRCINLSALKIGQRLKVGPDAMLEITRIGKECVAGCSIFKQLGDCIMPREGIFTRVLRGGDIKIGDKILLFE